MFLLSLIYSFFKFIFHFHFNQFWFFFLNSIDYIYVYLNGQIYNRYRLPDITSFPANSQATLLLGQETSDPNIQYGIRRRVKGFVGTISHFFLYAKPLSDADVRSAYNKLPSERNLLVGWDQFSGKASDLIKEIQYKNDRYPF